MTDERFQALQDAVQEILRKQADLEERVLRLERGYPVESTVASAVVSSPPPVVPLPADPISVPKKAPTAIPPRAAPAAAGERPAIETKVGLTLVNRIGVITLVLGVAFFFKWAVDNQWIGPTGRVLLGLLAGGMALGAADFLFRKGQKTFAQGISGAGLAILHLAAYAAFGFYHLIPQALAFAFLLSTTVFGVALSLRYDSPAIAALGLLGGYLTPLLLSTGEDHPWFLLSYVLLLDVAAMGLRRRKGWRVLEVLSFVATTIIYLAWFDQHESEHRRTAAATLGALAYYALFAYAGSGLILALSNFIGAVEILMVWPDTAGPFFAFELLITAVGMFVARLRQSPAVLSTAFASFWLCAGFFAIDSEVPSIGARFAGITLGFLLPFAFAALDGDDKEDSRLVSATTLAVLGANGTVYFGIAYALLRRDFHQWLGLLAICVAATYLALAALTRKRISLRQDADSRALLLQIGMAIAFITLAIPIQLTGFRITVGWALQAAVLTWLGAKFQSPRAYAGGAIVFALVATRLIILDAWLYRSTTDAPLVLFNARFLAFTVSAMCAFGAARWAVNFSRRLAFAEYLGAHIALLAGLTLEVVMWVARNAPVSNRISAETFSVSLLYGIYAVVLVSLGVATRTAVNRISGLSLIGVVIAKLYLFDVWQLDRVYRIAAFVALGILLISTSFLYSRYRHVLEALLRNDDTAS